MYVRDNDLFLNSELINRINTAAIDVAWVWLVNNEIVWDFFFQYVTVFHFTFLKTDSGTFLV